MFMFFLYGYLIHIVWAFDLQFNNSFIHFFFFIIEYKKDETVHFIFILSWQFPYQACNASSHYQKKCNALTLIF